MSLAIRWLIYLLLIIPPNYMYAITSPTVRNQKYRQIAYLAGVIAFIWALHRLLFQFRPRYRDWVRPRHQKVHRLLRLSTTIAFIIILWSPAVLWTIIGFGLMPWLFILFTAILIFWAVAQRKRQLPEWLRLDSVLVMLFYFYLSLFALSITYLGSGSATCRQAQSNEFLAPLITREDISRSGVVDSCFPYDVKSDSAADLLFFTLKEKRSGFIKVFGDQKLANDAIGYTHLSAPRLEADKLIPIIGPSTATYPQRITVNPERREIYVVVLDIDGRHAVRTLSYPPEWRITHSLQLDYEPIRVYFDNRERALIVLGYEGWVNKYDIDSYQPRTQHWLDGRGLFGMIDTLAWNSRRGVCYASVVSSRFLMLDAKNFKTLKSKRVWTPTIGVDYDEVTNRVFAAATLTRQILIMDGDNLNVLKRIWTGITVRELGFEPKRRLIVTAGYVDGYLDFYDPESLQRRARLFVGKLARGLHIEPQSSRIFVASSCGLIEVRVDKLLAASQNHETHLATFLAQAKEQAIGIHER